VANPQAYYNNTAATAIKHFILQTPRLFCGNYNVYHLHCTYIFDAILLQKNYCDYSSDVGLQLVN